MSSSPYAKTPNPKGQEKAGRRSIPLLETLEERELLTYAFSAFDFPGSTYTSASGISNIGQIVGTYYTADGVHHGFLKVGGDYQTNDYPGSSFTEFNGINDAGQIVGQQSSASGGPGNNGGLFGFLDDKGDYQSFLYPGGNFATGAYDINDTGQIVGYYVDSNERFHGFIKQDNIYEPINYPGAKETVTTGINNADQIVGYYRNQGTGNGFDIGFLKDGDGYHAIEYPSSTATHVLGINDVGQLVGEYHGSDGRFHGFLKDDGGYHSIDYPGSSNTTAYGINNAGRIVGEYNDRIHAHGFSATLDQIDLAVTQPTLSVDHGVGFGYTISGYNLIEPTTVALYWSADTRFDTVQDTLIPGSVTTTQLVVTSNPYPVQIDAAALGTPPLGARYLLVVIDPENSITESDEANNVQSLPLNDIALLSAMLVSPNSVTFNYSTTGDPGPFTIGLYPSPDGTSFDTTMVIATQTVTPSGANTPESGQFTLSSPLTPTAVDPYFVVVADPGKTIAESDETNNVKSILGKTDIVATQFGAEAGGLGAHYRIEGAPLPSATTAVFYWAKGPDLSYDHVLAADPIVISAGTSIGSHDDAGVLTMDEKPAPAGTTYLIVVFDPNNSVDESHEDNNVLSTEVHFSPSVELVAKHLDGSVVSNDAPLLFKEPFTISLTVTNPDSLAHDYHVTWTGSNSIVPGFTPDFVLPLDSDTGLIPPGGSVTLDSKTFIYRWDWIPKQNPLTTDESLRDKLLLALKDGLDNFDSILAGEIASAFLGKIGVGDILLSIANFAATTLPVILGEIKGSAKSINLDYTAKVSSPNTSTIGTHNQISLKVPTDKEQLLAESVFLSLIGPDIDETVSPLTTNAPLFVYFLQSIKLLFDASANSAYALAYDPPDANFTAIVTPSARDFPLAANAPASPLKDFLLTLATIDSLEQAEATSRDRADGAAAAGDYAWQSKQLFAAAGFGIQASYFQTRLLSLSAQLAPLGIFKVPSTDLNALGVLAGTFLTVAKSELTSATQIRTQHLGQMTRDLSSSELQNLTAQRNLIKGGIAGSIGSADRLIATETFISAVLSAIDATNNLSALQDDLDFGLGSLIILQQSASSGLVSFTAPTIQSFQRLGIHAQPTRLALTFSDALNATTVENRSNYVIVAAGADGRFGTKDDLRIGVKSASYDSVTRTVTLKPNRRLNWHQRFQITVKGTEPTGLADRSGNLMDGDGNGKSGGDYVGTFRHYGLIQSKPASVRTHAKNSAGVIHPHGPVVGRTSHRPHPAIHH